MSLNTLDSSPNFNVHRASVTTGDSGPYTKGQGVNGQDYDSAVVDLSLNSGSLASVDLEALYWSDAAGAYVSAAPTPDKVTLTAAGQFLINHASRRFFIQATNLSGTTPDLKVSVAGIRGGGLQFA